MVEKGERESLVVEVKMEVTPRKMGKVEFRKGKEGMGREV